MKKRTRTKIEKFIKENKENLILTSEQEELLDEIKDKRVAMRIFNIVAQAIQEIEYLLQIEEPKDSQPMSKTMEAGHAIAKKELEKRSKLILNFNEQITDILKKLGEKQKLDPTHPIVEFYQTGKIDGQSLIDFQGAPILES